MSMRVNLYGIFSKLRVLNDVMATCQHHRSVEPGKGWRQPFPISKAGSWHFFPDVKNSRQSLWVTVLWRRPCCHHSSCGKTVVSTDACCQGKSRVRAVVLMKDGDWYSEDDWAWVVSSPTRNAPQCSPYVHLPHWFPTPHTVSGHFTCWLNEIFVYWLLTLRINKARLQTQRDHRPAGWRWRGADPGASDIQRVGRFGLAVSAGVIWGA